METAWSKSEEYHGQEDRELLLAISKAKESRDTRTMNYAFEALYWKYQPPVFGFISRLYPRYTNQWKYEVAEDTFLKVWLGAHTFGERSAVGTWIFAIASNAAKERLRGDSKEDDTLLEGDMDRYAWDTDNPERRAVARAVLRTLPALVGEQNAQIAIMYGYEFPGKVTAATVGLSHAAVRTRMSQMRKVLTQAQLAE